MSSQPLERLLRPAGFLLGAVAILIPVAAFGQTCEWSVDRTPALPVVSTLWGELEPVDLGSLPANRDTTDAHGALRPGLP